MNQCPDTIRIQIESINSIIVSLFITLVYIFILFQLSIWNLLVVSISFLISVFFKKINKKSIYEITNIKVKISETMSESFQN